MRLERGQGVDDRYTLVERLGSGGMADVWLADDRMLDRQVALKFLHESFGRDASFVERFRREAQSAAGLQHPNIVGVYDRGEIEDRHFIAMEYVEGAALNELIERGLEAGEAVEIVRQVLAGASFAHEHGIVHRDLKPQNVLIDGEGRAQVTDFGIARAGVSSITHTGSVLGTAQYLSPEQAQGLDVTAAADIYSVGVMLYETLTGRVPFEAESPVAVALKQVSERPRPPSELNSKVSPALDAVVLRALAKDPANRFATAREFSQALDAAEADPSGGGLGKTAAYTPVAVIEAPPEEEPAGWMTRRRAAILALLALLAAAIVVWALTRSEQVNVPAVIGQPVSEAGSLLEREGFEVAVNEFESCDELDTVTEQDPPAGTEAEEGSRVSLDVSLGQLVRVPLTRDLPEAQATRRIDDSNLLAETRDQPSRSIRAGRVISSEPASGDEVDCKSTVTLLVSTGPNLIAVPDVRGDQEDVASAQLEDLGLTVDVDPRDADEPEGTVLDQDPVAGTELRRDERVTLIVSTGVGSVVMPAVEGQSEQAATATLEARRLSADVETRETDDASEDGRVLDQAPPSGTRLRAGDTVTIVVGELVEPEPEPEPTTTTTDETTTTPDPDPEVPR